VTLDRLFAGVGVRNPYREAIERLESKTLDARFTSEIQQWTEIELDPSHGSYWGA
jgi:hypothetical protein